MNGARLRHLIESLVIAALFTGAFRSLGLLGGWLEVLCALALPLALCEAAFRGRGFGWLWLGPALGMALGYAWVPAVMETKGGLPHLASLGVGLLFWAYEGLGLALVAWTGARLLKRGPWAAACGAALAWLLWERFAFHIYDWSWGSAFGALPFLARSAAFLPSPFLGALAWGTGALAASGPVQARPRRLAAPFAAFALMALLGTAWHLLPRTEAHRLDVLMIQPNFPVGERFPGMQARAWAQTEAALAAHHLPRTGEPLLVLWPESSVLGQDHRGVQPLLHAEAERRGVAWLFGTEGGLYNLIRGEAPGRPSFLQAKVVPMWFGERNPGPPALRHFLDRQMGILSQEPGELTTEAFRVPTPTGDVRVHPLICSEALLPERSRAGLTLSGADLLTNHTNDGWFDQSPATRLHGAQIRLRAAELGVPLVRCTLSGMSGVYREDGTGHLWGEPLTRAEYAFSLAWRPVQTPARSAAWNLLLAGLLAAAAGVLAWRSR
ncbi:MAG TPA: nitrilase-related carbon-nitrogen hydrolase [Holophagaceae bacterium]|nr:nitrilase-related carbon-nitrogen hydrolase [Holophagaceae bacterium]